MINLGAQVGQIDELLQSRYAHPKKSLKSFFLTEKKSKNFSTSSKKKNFEQHYFYEVLRFNFLLESGQPNMICSRDSPFGFLIENVSRHVML